MAGKSAEHAARRMRERAERLHRAAELWERGAEGERRTAEALAAPPAHEWTVFHDVPWPGRARANIDHVAVGPTGVFVIDSKHWSGSVTVRDGVLRQNGYRRDKTVSGAVDASSAVHSLVPAVRREDVHPVLCFVRDQPLAATIGSVVVTSVGGLADELHMRPLVFPPEGRERVAWELELKLHRGARRLATTQRRPPSASSPASASRPRTRSRLVPAIVGVALALVVLVAGLTYVDAAVPSGHTFVSQVSEDSSGQPAGDKGKDHQRRDRAKRHKGRG